MKKSEVTTKRPFPIWICFYIAFAMLFVAWYFLFKIAYENQPEVVPLAPANAEVEKAGSKNR